MAKENSCTNAEIINLFSKHADACEFAKTHPGLIIVSFGTKWCVENRKNGPAQYYGTMNERDLPNDCQYSDDEHRHHEILVSKHLTNENYSPTTRIPLPLGYEPEEDDEYDMDNHQLYLLDNESDHREDPDDYTRSHTDGWFYPE